MKKEKNIGLIIIIILLLIVVSLSTYVICDNFIFNSTNNINDVESEKEDNQSIDGEKKLESTDTIEKLNVILDLLSPSCNLSRYSIYEIKTLTHEDKMKITFESLADKFVDLTLEERKANSYREYVDVKKINISEVKAQYKNLFGEEPTELGNYGRCPTYRHDTTNNVYYKEAGGCGGTCASSITTYINSYTEDENNIYVYTSVGYLTSRYSKSYVYCDINVSKLCYSGEIIDYNNIINETNYQDFSEYRLTFKKNADGTFYYDKIERLK